jgi:crotonobetainyl-CoA:carnitine CoA-transferase CaiB-like acyl-CoA transferase
VRPLDGLKVLDLSRLLPGPYCTLMFADLGADVVKVEEPKGDYLRWWPPYWPHGDVPTAAAFAALNRNKRSISVDLKDRDGLALVLRLAEKADVLVEQFRPGVMDKLGLSYDALAKQNPGLVYCSITGYGQTGPYKDRAGHDLNYVGRSGLLWHNARAGEPPHPLSVQLADLAGGALFPATAILAALYARSRTGLGTHIDAAMSDACVALMPFFASQATLSYDGPGEGLLHGGVPAYNVYPTRDRKFIAVGALEPKFWAELCDALNRSDLAAAGLLTGEDGKRVWRELAAIFSAETQAHWSAFFRDKDCCVEPVMEIKEALADRHNEARGLFLTVDQAGAPMRQVRTPIFLRGFDAPRSDPSPRLGADRDAVVADWIG